eukprot:Hpha_TRINITY_DN4485_c0_g1::TRINITY_DN4485_c0_g1_i1::g.50422::m.50422
MGQKQTRRRSPDNSGDKLAQLPTEHLSTETEGQARVTAALSAVLPEAAEPASPGLLRFFSGRYLLRVTACMQHGIGRGGPAKRVIASTRLNLYVCKRNGEAVRMLQYRQIAGVRVHSLDEATKCEVLFRVHPPEPDILVEVSEAAQPPLRIGASVGGMRDHKKTPHASVKALLDCITRAHAAVTAGTLDVSWVGSGLQSGARLSGNCPGLGKSAAGEVVESLSIQQCVELSGVRFAPPPPVDPQQPQGPLDDTPPLEPAAASALGLLSSLTLPVVTPNELTPEQCKQRMDAALGAGYPEVAKGAARGDAMKKFPDTHALIAIACEKFSHQGNVQRRWLVPTRFNVFLCGGDSRTKRIVQYRHLIAATARPCKQGRAVELLLQTAPPEHDILLRVWRDKHDDSILGVRATSPPASYHPHVHALLCCLSRAREHMAGSPLPVRWVQESAGKLRDHGQIKKLAGWRAPEALVEAAQAEKNKNATDPLAFHMALSGVRYAPPPEDARPEASNESSWEEGGESKSGGAEYRFAAESTGRGSSQLEAEDADAMLDLVQQSPRICTSAADFALNAATALLAGDLASARDALGQQDTLTGLAPLGPPPGPGAGLLSTMDPRLGIGGLRGARRGYLQVVPPSFCKLADFESLAPQPDAANVCFPRPLLGAVAL